MNDDRVFLPGNVANKFLRQVEEQSDIRRKVMPLAYSRVQLAGPSGARRLEVEISEFGPARGGWTSWRVRVRNAL